MLDFIQSQILFFISITLVLFFPGYFLMLAIWGKKKNFSSLEKFFIPFGLSIAIADFLLILISKLGIPLNKFSIIISITIFILLSTFIRYLIVKYKKVEADNSTDNTATNKAFSFTRNQIILIILIFFLTIFIKTAFLTNAIYPSSTDLAHHMYWTNVIIQTGELPQYQEAEIINVNNNYEIGQPQKISDFVIGEHIIFSAIAMLSGSSVMSPFTSLVLFLINIIGIGAVFILALRLFQNYVHGKNVAIFSLFLLGPLYAISSSQAKYISGGVIGNIIGSLLIPLAIYFYYRAFREKRASLLTIGLFLTAGIFYTHHLSALIFIFISLIFLLAFLFINIETKVYHVKNWLKILISPAVIISIVAAIIFLFAVYTPTYIESGAVKTVIGEPSKSTKAGISFSGLSYAVGESRMVLGLFGILILLILRRKFPYQSALLFSWFAAIFLMSWKPSILNINIPSSRIANYLSIPLIIAGSFAVFWIFSKLTDKIKNKHLLPNKLILSIFILLLIFITVSGLFDNSQFLKTSSNSDAAQTFHASRYLSEKTSSQDVILKDHNYLSADAWMKLYFMRDYNYPLTRSYFFRYEENKNREHCTLYMITSPDSEEGKKCYNDLSVNYIVVNPAYDTIQFQRVENFERIYNGKAINIYYRVKNINQKL